MEPRPNSSSSGLVYAGGNFTNLNGDTRAAYAGALDEAQGTVSSSFLPQPGFPIIALTTGSGGVYAGGGGAGGHEVIWNTDGSLQRPAYQTDGAVQAVAVSDGSLFASGRFTNYYVGNTGAGKPFICDNPLQRRKLFQIDLASGNLTSFAPAFNSPHGLVALAADPADGTCGSAVTSPRWAARLPRTWRCSADGV